MKIATWNVNSLKVRLPQVLDWLSRHEPDALALQEIKQVTEAFPGEDFAAMGYRSVASGQKTYNGVALIARAEPLDVLTDFPGFADPQRRVLAATIDGVRIVNLYVPNGSQLGSEKYADKLERHERLVVLGDFNIAPQDQDVYDAERWGEAILCSPEERQALRALLDLGFSDVFRNFEQPEKTFSWWDYRAAGFRRNAGLRIDLILASAAIDGVCTASYVDKAPRALERPSDHAPVVAEFDLEALRPRARRPAVPAQSMA